MHFGWSKVNFKWTIYHSWVLANPLIVTTYKQSCLRPCGKRSRSTFRWRCRRPLHGRGTLQAGMASHRQSRREYTLWVAGTWRSTFQKKIGSIKAIYFLWIQFLRIVRMVKLVTIANKSGTMILSHLCRFWIFAGFFYVQVCFVSPHVLYTEHINTKNIGRMYKIKHR